MQLVKLVDGTPGGGVGILEDDHVVPLDLNGGQYRNLADILESDHPGETALLLRDDSRAALPADRVRLQAPIDQQEVWAAGVTYRRSQKARMEESADGSTFYDKVYEADRPELFFKANPHRVVGPGQSVRIRQDTRWSVPEPELALVLNSRLELVGFTVGNDMSARDIEGENPLYLPQAKVYDACCALGPSIRLRNWMPAVSDVGVRMTIVRNAQEVYAGQTDLGQLNRSYEELIGWLGRDCSFPTGAILLTGTGIVPDDGFTLFPGDVISISIDGIGTLTNSVVQG